MRTKTTEVSLFIGDDGNIRLAFPRLGIISTISNSPTSGRYHPHLYNKLFHVLKTFEQNQPLAIGRKP